MRFKRARYVANMRIKSYHTRIIGISDDMTDIIGIWRDIGRPRDKSFVLKEFSDFSCEQPTVLNISYGDSTGSTQI